MSKFESLTAAIEAEGGFEKSWADLSEALRRRIERDFPLIAGTSIPPSAAGIAIVGNAAMAAQGSWQYSTDDKKTWLDIPTSGLSDTNAIVLSTPAALRFSPSANWYGNPGALTARVSDGTVGLPAPGVQDISAGIGRAGQWLAGTITISEAVNTLSGIAITANTLPARGGLWDSLSIDQRRAAARDRDTQHHPTNGPAQEIMLRFLDFQGGLEKEVAKWEAFVTSTAHDEDTKKTNLFKLRQKLARVTAYIRKLTNEANDNEPVPADTSRFLEIADEVAGLNPPLTAAKAMERLIESFEEGEFERNGESEVYQGGTRWSREFHEVVKDVSSDASYANDYRVSKPILADWCQHWGFRLPPRFTTVSTADPETPKAVPTVSELEARAPGSTTMTAAEPQEQPATTAGPPATGADPAAWAKLIVDRIVAEERQLLRNQFKSMLGECPGSRLSDKEIDAVWKKVAPPDWQKEGQGRLKNDRRVIDWRAYLPKG